jgi:hypothetical protein
VKPLQRICCSEIRDINIFLWKHRALHVLKPDSLLAVLWSKRRLICRDSLGFTKIRAKLLTQ